jgi:C1A family cysteine protease
VLVVGFAVAYEINKTYFIIQNSWGPHWGDKGYGYIAADDNECGIFNDIV